MSCNHSILRLHEVIKASRMNKELAKEGRRWYARGLLENEEMLKTIEKEAPDFCLKTSLTTLSFMALKTNEDNSSMKEVHEKQRLLIISLNFYETERGKYCSFFLNFSTTS